MPKPSRDERNGSHIIKDHSNSEAAKAAFPSSSASQEALRRHRIVVNNVTSNSMGVVVAASSKRNYDSFEERGRNARILPSDVQIVPRPKSRHHVAEHVAPGDSELETRRDPSTGSKTHVSACQTQAKHFPMRHSTSSHTSSADYSRFVPQTKRTPVVLSQKFKKPSSQHPNFAALFASRKKRIQTVSAPGNGEEDEDTMSIEKVVPDQQVKSAKKPRRKRSPQRKAGQSAGRWTNLEHRAFLEGLKEFGREWKKVATRIPTRTSAQIRSHAQKYFAKLQREQEAMALTDHASHGSALQQHSQQFLALPVTPSVQRNIERLIADPQAAQREVENTLQALKDRYRQLQSQLERRRNGQNPDLYKCSDPLQDSSASVCPEVGDSVTLESRKRSYQEFEPTTSSHQLHDDYDDQSSVTTNITSSVASLGNEELIALHVLGGALPRNESSGSLRDLATVASVSSALASKGSPESELSNRKLKTSEKK